MHLGGFQETRQPRLAVGYLQDRRYQRSGQQALATRSGT